MAVVTRNRVTTITPTAWRWYAGAGAILLLSAWTDMLSIMHLAVAAGIAAMGTGMVYRMVLDPEGFSYTFGLGNKRFSWAKVADFRVNTMRYGLFSVMQQVAFTDLDKAESLGGKLAKFVSGGTNTMPVFGMEASKLIRLMHDYQLGGAPADTPADTPAKAAPSAIERVLPKPVASPQAGRPVTRPVQPSKPVLARGQVGSATPVQKGRLAAGQDPLIQDSASRRRATRNAPLG